MSMVVAVSLLIASAQGLGSLAPNMSKVDKKSADQQLIESLGLAEIHLLLFRRDGGGFRVEGIVVSQVEVGSEAAKAGLKKGDIIVAVDDERIRKVPMPRWNYDPAVERLAPLLTKKRTSTLLVVRQEGEQRKEFEVKLSRPACPDGP